MTPASLVARVGRGVVRALVALHPADFRRAFGSTVVEETAADIEAAVPFGVRATFAVVARSAADGARGAVIERTTACNSSRKAMQNAFMSDVRHAVRTLARDRGFTTVALGTLTVSLAL